MSFAAKYDGLCIHGDDIKMGDEVQMSEDGIAHADCQARHNTPRPRAERYVDELDIAARAASKRLGRNERHCANCNLIHAGDCW